MKNNLFIKKPKTAWIALLVLFFGLFANEAMGQDTYTWIKTSGDWGTPGNWSKVSSATNSETTLDSPTVTLSGANVNAVVGAGVSGAGIPVGTTITNVNGLILTISSNATATAVAASLTYRIPSATVPGNAATDVVTINNGGNPIIGDGVAIVGYALTRVTITNALGPLSGSTLTISPNATLTLNSSTVAVITLQGGNIVNNGTLNLTSTNTGVSAGITCATPNNVSGLMEYSYSGSGALNISVSASTTANSAAINVTSLNANPTYKFLFNGATSFSLSSAATSYVIRSAGGTAASPVIIGGAGFTHGTVSSPVTGGLLSVGQQSTVTVNNGTTLTMNSLSGNLTSGVVVGNSSLIATTFINKGNIYIAGTSARSGLQFNTFLGLATLSPFNITNEGIFSVNLNCTNVSFAPLMAGNGGSTNTTTSPVNLTNTGTLTFINTSTAAGTGYAIFGLVASQAPPVTITNNGTLNLEGSSYSYGNKFSIINNGILKSNSELRSFTAITNNIGGSINFVRTAATATTRQVTFTVPTGSTVGLGTTYTDVALNTYVVVSQTYGATYTTLVTNVLSIAITTPAPNSLTKTGSGAGDANINYTGFSAPLANGALTSPTTNSGIINTDTESNLNIISDVTTSTTSIIAPGGSAGKGITDFAKVADVSLTGKTILQIAGDATAGVDYDQIINSLGGALTVGGTLDITGIYTPAGPVTIEIVKATGNLTGNFGIVIGLTTGWSVVPTAGAGGKIELVYNPTPTVTNPVWIGVASAGWINPLNWENGVVPNQDSNVTIRLGTLDPPSFQPSSFVSINIKSLTIDPGASLQINTGHNLTVKEAIVNNGTLTLASNANLIQVNNVTNLGAGTTTINRNSNLLSRLDYTLWSSPVTGSQTLGGLGGFSPVTDTDRFYTYNESSNLYNSILPSTTFASATGYLIRMPNDHPASPTVWSGSFTGNPNNGDITKAVTYGGATNGYNAIGNPYPSTIDAQAFIAANTANIESSLYFWRKINAAAGSAYAVYNPMGSTIATPSSAVPNGTIQVGQGFFVKAKSASNVNFTNAMRVANNQNQIFKTKQVAQKDRVWLNLTNTSGVFSQALVGYTADATMGVDMYDAKYFNDSQVVLTSNINNEEYTIQGRAAFDPTDVVALNFKTAQAGDYTIALDQFDGVFATGQDIYLLDSKTGTETDLKAGSYTFAAVAGTDNARFSLKYQKTLKVDAAAFNENSVSVYKNNGTLYVNAGSVTINTIEVYDVQGRLLASQRNVKATTASINNLRASNQVLIVKIAGVDNSVVTKKVVN